MSGYNAPDRKNVGIAAIVALARRLAVILHRIWVDGTEFRWHQGTGRSSMKTLQDHIR